MNLPTSDRQVFNEIHNIFNIVRQLVYENRVLYDSIDESYEEVLTNDLKLVPEQFDSYILKAINTVKLVVSNINFTNISNGINDIYTSVLHFHVNTFNKFLEGLAYIKLTKQEMLSVKNLTIKFKPLFNCIDAICADPIAYIHKIAQLQNTQYDNIF